MVLEVSFPLMRKSVINADLTIILLLWFLLSGINSITMDSCFTIGYHFWWESSRAHTGMKLVHSKPNSPVLRLDPPVTVEMHTPWLDWSKGHIISELLGAHVHGVSTSHDYSIQNLQYFGCSNILVCSLRSHLQLWKRSLFSCVRVRATLPDDLYPTRKDVEEPTQSSY